MPFWTSTSPPFLRSAEAASGWWLVVQFGGLQAQRDQARVKSFIDILMNGCGMTAAFKDIMALINNDPGWRNVRAPLVPLTDAQMVQLSTQLADFALDQAID